MCSTKNKTSRVTGTVQCGLFLIFSAVSRLYFYSYTKLHLPSPSNCVIGKWIWQMWHSSSLTSLFAIWKYNHTKCAVLSTSLAFMSWGGKHSSTVIFVESFTDESKQQVHSQLGSPQLGSLDQLIQMFPSHEVTFLKDVLVKNGTISDAVAETLKQCNTTLFNLIQILNNIIEVSINYDCRYHFLL